MEKEVGADIPQQVGRYEIIGEIGRGGFATVYRARDPELARDVALKVLDPLLCRDPLWVARFRREARAVARLDHPRVVTIYEVGQAENLVFIAMRLIEGGSLAQRITRQGPLPWPEIVRLTGELAEGLDFAHDNGVVHRDLKSANVLLDSERGALLTDFGFARLVAEHTLSTTLSGGMIGTPAYMAPEVWEGVEAKPQTDVYALGCILFEAAMGEHLFQGNSTPAIMRAHFEPLELPAAWPPGVPGGFSDVLQTALAKEPSLRYPRAGELAGALTALREDPRSRRLAALRASLATGEWEPALGLVAAIRAEQGDSPELAALESAALEGLDRAKRVEAAATWREEAERALADGDRQGATVAVRQWQRLLPGDVEVRAFLRRLESPPEPVRDAAPAPNFRRVEVVDRSQAPAGLVRACPNCGTSNLSESAFCGRCGSPLAGAAPRAAPVQAWRADSAPVVMAGTGRPAGLQVREPPRTLTLEWHPPGLPRWTWVVGGALTRPWRSVTKVAGAGSCLERGVRWGCLMPLPVIILLFYSFFWCFFAAFWTGIEVLAWIWRLWRYSAREGRLTRRPAVATASLSPSAPAAALPLPGRKGYTLVVRGVFTADELGTQADATGLLGQPGHPPYLLIDGGYRRPDVFADFSGHRYGFRYRTAGSTLQLRLPVEAWQWSGPGGQAGSLYVEVK